MPRWNFGRLSLRSHFHRSQAPLFFLVRQTMSYFDKELSCRDCGAGFTFTAGQQEFFASKGFDNAHRPPLPMPGCLLVEL